MADQLHHSGIQVEDIERAAAFYLGVFDGHYLFKRAVNDQNADYVMGGGPDVAFAFCYIGFASGAIELIEFLGEPPEWAKRPRDGRLPHFAMRVDDVAACVERVEALGGSRVWPEPISWGGATVMYVNDPDGNPIELFDVPLEGIVSRTLELFPDSTP
jgi:catechol 2,3-dioxygenase-like lactoylglutathione lyase family enzyme